MVTSIRETYQLARAQRLSHHQAVTAVAIAIAESSLNENAIGDTALVNATWGPSVGLWQIRSLKAHTGTGRERDVNRLTDRVFNARSMAIISSYGLDWSPWSTYTNRAYAAHVNTVEAEVGNGSGLGSGLGGLGGGVAPNVPTPGGPLPNLGGTGGGLGVGLPGVELDDLGASILKGLVIAAGVGLGVTLVAIGAWRAVSSGSGS